jgi:hypothetical protein
VSYVLTLHDLGHDPCSEASVDPIPPIFERILPLGLTEDEVWKLPASMVIDFDGTYEIKAGRAVNLEGTWSVRDYRCAVVGQGPTATEAYRDYLERR